MKRLEDAERTLEETQKKLKVEQELRRREGEENHKQEQEERQGTLTEKNVPIHVETTQQPIDEEQGEKVQVQDLPQQVEQMVEAMGIEIEQEPHDQDTDLMLRESKVTPQSLPHIESQSFLSKKGEVVLLDDDSEMDMYNLSFNKS